MWEVVGGPFLAAAALLVLAGAPKLADPLPLMRALRSVRLPAHRGGVRLLAAGEVAIGLAAIAVPSRWTALAVALAYLGFTGFVALALSRGGVLASCGCFSKPDTPPTRIHVGLTATLALCAAAIAVDPPASVVWTATSWPALAALGAFAGLLAWLSYVVIAVLPTVSPAAVRSASAPRRD
jgi:hypothetical protein